MWPAYRVFLDARDDDAAPHVRLHCKMRMPQLEMGSDPSVALISYLVEQDRPPEPTIAAPDRNAREGEWPSGQALRDGHDHGGH